MGRGGTLPEQLRLVESSFEYAVDSPNFTNCPNQAYRFGKGGGGGRLRSEVRNSSMITSIARFSWSSTPAYSRPGSLSTTISGSTPCPSIAQSFPSTSYEANSGLKRLPPSINGKDPRIPIAPPQLRLPISLPSLY